VISQRPGTRKKRDHDDGFCSLQHRLAPRLELSQNHIWAIRGFLPSSSLIASQRRSPVKFVVLLWYLAYGLNFGHRL
jgi:hypothetical protein